MKTEFNIPDAICANYDKIHNYAMQCFIEKGFNIEKVVTVIYKIYNIYRSKNEREWDSGENKEYIKSLWIESFSEKEHEIIKEVALNIYSELIRLESENHNK